MSALRELAFRGTILYEGGRKPFSADGSLVHWPLDNIMDGACVEGQSFGVPHAIPSTAYRI